MPPSEEELPPEEEPLPDDELPPVDEPEPSDDGLFPLSGGVTAELPEVDVEEAFCPITSRL